MHTVMSLWQILRIYAGRLLSFEMLSSEMLKKKIRLDRRQRREMFRRSRFSFGNKKKKVLIELSFIRKSIYPLLTKLKMKNE